MRVPLRAYRRLAAAGFRRQSAYRLAMLGGLIANLTFGLLKLAILRATVRAAGGELAGYDQASMGAYVWLSQALLASVNLYGHTDIADRIRDGSIVVDFLRPLDIQLASTATEVGGAAFVLLPRAVPLLSIGLLTGVPLPSGASAYLLGIPSVVLGITTSWLAAYLVAACGFWLVETRGVQVLYMVASGFLAGLFIPLSLFPAWLLAAAQATPFPSMLMYPIDVLSGRVQGAAATGLVAEQVGWLLLVAGIGAAMTRAGRRRLEVQGG